MIRELYEKISSKTEVRANLIALKKPSGMKTKKERWLIFWREIMRSWPGF